MSETGSEMLTSQETGQYLVNVLMGLMACHCDRTRLAGQGWLLRLPGTVHRRVEDPRRQAWPRETTSPTPLPHAFLPRTLDPAVSAAHTPSPVSSGFSSTIPCLSSDELQGEFFLLFNLNLSLGWAGKGFVRWCKSHEQETPSISMKTLLLPGILRKRPTHIPGNTEVFCENVSLIFFYFWGAGG